MTKRIIKVTRGNPSPFSIRVDIHDAEYYGKESASLPLASVVASLSLTVEEALELESILGLFRYNNWLSSLTGSIGPEGPQDDETK